MPHQALSYAAWVLAALLFGYGVLRLFWHALGVYKVRRAGPRPLAAARHVLWRDPGDVERLDLVSGPGGRDCMPVPPYRFLAEHASGSQPCVSVIDGRDRRWRV